MTISPRIALVTGANKGIGLEIARQLALAGVHVLIGARSPERGTVATQNLAAEGLEVAFIQLDIEDETSIASAARSIAEEHGRLDILVNNAGIGDPEDGAPSRASLQAVRHVLETNFIGTLAVTQAMLPLLRISTAGRIVNLSSGLGSLAMNGDPSSPSHAMQLIGYNASKAAINMLTIQLNEELRESSIVVNSVSPGFARTDMTGNTGFVTAAEAATTPVYLALLDQTTAFSGRFVSSEGDLRW